MLKKFFLGRLSQWLVPLMLIAVVMLSIGATAKYYYYADDFALLYHLQHSIRYSWPYHHLIDFFLPIYRLFGYLPSAYFLIDIGLYVLNVIALYITANILTRQRLLSIAAACIFATGYIGIDQFTEVASLHESVFLLVIFAMVLLMFRYVVTRKLQYYLMTLVLYYISFEVFTIRIFLPLLILPTIDIFYSIRWSSIKDFFKSGAFVVLRMLPLVWIARILLTTKETIAPGEDVTAQISLIRRLSDIVSVEKIGVFSSIFSRMIIWEPFRNFFGIETQMNVIGFIGLCVCLAFGIYCLRHKKFRSLGTLFLLTLALVIEGYVGFFIRLPSFASQSEATRYLIFSAPWVALLLPLSVYALGTVLNNRRKHVAVVILTLLFTLVGIRLSMKFVSKGITYRSAPSYSFFQSLSRQVPAIKGKTIFYFVTSRNPTVAGTFSQIIIGAAMPREVVLAAYYKVPISDITVVLDDFNGLTKILSEQKSPVHFYSFYYDEHGLTQTTQLLKQYYSGEMDTIPLIVPSPNVTPVQDMKHTDILLDVPAFSSLTPLDLSVTMKVQQLPPSAFIDTIAKESSQRDPDDVTKKQLLISYLAARKFYAGQAKVTASDYYHGEYGVRGPELMIDDDDTTSWLENSEWERLRSDWVQIDLGEVKSISRLFWFIMKDRMPKAYTIEVSQDAKMWKPVTYASSMTESSSYNYLIDTFGATDARYVRVTISELIGDLSPAVIELEPVESRFASVDLIGAQKYKSSPFSSIQNQEDVNFGYAYIKEHGKVQLTTESDNSGGLLSEFTQSLPVILDDQYHTYSIQVKPQGTKMKRLHIYVNFPSAISVSSVQMSSEVYRGSAMDTILL